MEPARAGAGPLPERPRVLFVGGARFSRPLSGTARKKYAALNSVAEVSVLGFSSDARGRRFREIADFILLPALPAPSLRYLVMALAAPVVVAYRVLRGRVAAVVAQSPYEGALAALGVAVARRLGGRVALVVESHGDFERSRFLERRIRLAALQRRLMDRVARRALAAADVLRVISTSTATQVAEWSERAPVHRFPAWTDIEIFFAAGGRAERAPAPRLVFAGVLTPLKGVHVLVEAFAALASVHPDATLVVAGRPQNEEYARALRARVAELGLGQRVEFAGELSQEALAEHLMCATAFVLPSFSEGLGRVVLEAMAAGVTVVASGVGGIPDLVREGETGYLLPPGDAEALARRLAWVVENPGPAAEVAARGRAFARTIFSTESYVGAYAALFEDAMRRAR